MVVFGHPTLSRPVMRLMQRDDVEVLSVPPRGALDRAAVPGRRSTSTRGRTVEAPDESDWLDRWRAADRRVGQRASTRCSPTRPT